MGSLRCLMSFEKKMDGFYGIVVEIAAVALLLRNDPKCGGSN